MALTSLHTSAFALLLSLTATSAFATEWHVAVGGAGSGTAAAPFGRIQDALNAAQPGDSIVVGPGTYTERLGSVRGGSAQQPITARAAGGRGSVIVTSSGRVLSVAHPYIVIDSLVLDGQFGADDIVRVASAATGFTLRNSEVRRTSRDAVDMAGPTDVLIEGSVIHDALNATNGRTDAHGIVAGPARRLTIRNTEIHTFSGDAFQIDPGRSAPGWTGVVIEGCRFWLEPLRTATNGFAAGTVPGENAVDTKVGADLPRAALVIRNSEMFGFRGGLIANMAALNLKENIDAVVDAVTIHSSEIAFRLRAPAAVRVQNAVMHDVAYGVRYEENIQGLRIWNSTFGTAVARPFYAASSSGSVLDVRNVALLGTTLPREASGPSNLALPSSAFVDAANHDYQLTAGSSAVDAGVAIAEVTADRKGTKRPQGAAYDIGAYERPAAGSEPSPANDDIVLYAWRASVIEGNWRIVSDSTAAGSARIMSRNRKVTFAAPSPMPANYFELSFEAEAGRAYRLWIRGNAKDDSPANDSVYVQFDGSVDAGGTPVFRIGSSAATVVNLEDCSGCGLAQWGWQDNGFGVHVLGPLVYFASTGPQTIRIQTREDGFSIDQIVLSASTYASEAPGALKRDTTILPESSQ